MESFDIIVLGGGVCGIGAALEAGRNGFKTLLLEKEHCFAGASANSLRVIHGGLRYLPSLEFGALLESLRNQTILLGDYPEFIKPQRFAFALNGKGLQTKWPAQMGAYIYDLIALLFKMKRAKGQVLGAQQVASEIRALAGNAPFGALTWEDGLLINPPCFFAALKLKLSDSGVALIEGSEVTKVTKEAGAFTVILSNNQSWRGKVVIDCLGYHSTKIAKPKDCHGFSFSPVWSRACNFILSRQIEANFGVGVEEPGGRAFFLTPRDNTTALGTWYLPLSTEQEEVALGSGETLRLLQEFTSSFPWLGLAPSDVTQIEWGYYPLMALNNGVPSFLGRGVVQDYQGYIEVLTTKLTTFFTQGREIIKVAKRYL